MKQKPENGYRIFIFGGSSAAGYPYYYNATFSQMLKFRLDSTLKDKHIEVINLAMPAINSYTILDLAKDVFEYQPDVLLIYTGHNEFYGALGTASNERISELRFMVKIFLKLQQYRTFQLLQNTINSLKTIFVSEIDGRVLKQKTLMERMVANKRIRYGSEIYWKTADIFKDNLVELFRLGKDKNIEIVISEVVSNLKDQPPFISISTHHNDYPIQFNSDHNKTFYSQDINQLLKEIQLDSGYAFTHFKLAKKHESIGNISLSRKHFYKAKDFDGLRFRASEDFNNISKQVCKENKIKYLPMTKVFEHHSKNGLIGNELMLDHLHPNLDGTSLIALSFYNAIKDWNDIDSTSIADLQVGITDLDKKIGELRINILKAGWPFQEISHVEEFLQNYEPVTIIERVAFDYWRGKFSWEKAHIAAAKYYESQGEYNNAENEYIALKLIHFYDPAFYNELGRLYIAQNKISEAREVLIQSYNVKHTNFACRMLGAIYVEAKDIYRGKSFLNEAIRLNPKDIQSLYNLAGAYAINSEYNKSEEILNRLLKLNPNHQKGLNLLEQVKRTY